MKWVTLALLSMNVYAADCYLYQLQGDVVQDRTVRLTVNKGTNSQRVFVFSPEIEFAMGPYIQRTVKGNFVTKDLEILKIEEVNLTVPDPLYHHREMVRVKSVPCPKPKKKT